MAKISIILFFLINSVAAFSQYGVYHVIAARAHEPQSMFTADLDEDGDLDILIASADDNKIVWLENINDGVFAAQKVISDNAISAWYVYADDLDGDGDMDVLSASGVDSKIAWYENYGGGNFSPERIVTLDAYGAICVHTSDLDNDGELDIVSASSADDKVAWYRNLGDGTFGPQIIISQEMVSPRSVFAIDLNGDGFKDVLSASNYDDKIAWFENNGSGEFGPPQVISNTADGAQSVYAIDLDGDGDPDVLSASSLDDKIAWYENLGDGVFGVEQIISDDAEIAEHAYSADVDGDGDNDILSASFGDYKIAWYENLGGGSFESEAIISILTANPTSVHVGDIDGDGVQDVISSALGFDRVVWQKNLGGGIFDEEIITTTDTHFPVHGAVGDVDNDGDLDLITGGTFLEKIMLFKNVDNGEFSREIIVSSGGEEVHSLGLSDLDLDGDLDILASAYSPSSPDKIMRYENLGDGVYGDMIVISDEVLKGRSIITNDLNDDGYPDILLAEQTYDKVSWFPNLGDGTFGDQITISTEGDAPQCLFVADLDNDGDDDLLVASYLDDKIAWLERTGIGTFEDEQIITTEADGVFWVHSEDLDNDGDLDVLSASSIDNKIAWYENLGGGIWSDQKVLSSESLGANSVYTADVDGDGDFDVLATSNLDNRIDWFENLGGTFMGRQEISTRAMAAMFVYSADFDGDSDADVISIARTNDEILWHENQYISPLRIAGDCFFDINANGIRDTNDFKMKFVDINCTPGPLYTYTNFEGNYVADFTKGILETYVLMPETSPLWSLTTDSLSYTVPLDDSFESIDSANFGFTPNLKVDSLGVYLTGGWPRCDFDVNYWIDIHNLGNTSPSGIIQLELAENITFVTASLEPDSVIDQSVYWHYDSLFYYDETDLNVIVEMPGVEFIDDTLTSILTVNVDSMGTILFEVTDTLSQILICSFDPNDKIVTPKGIDSLGFILPTVEKLEYTVRFQNTGTDTAINVRIKDQLDPSINWTSLTYLASSHATTTTLFPSGEIIFKFDNIMLPDSNTNELASHGFVRFKVDLNEDLPLGTKIYNGAAIYFDANEPVITNTTINTIFDCNYLLKNTVASTSLCQGDSLYAKAHLIAENFNYTWTLFDETETGNEYIQPIDTSGTFNLELSLSTPLCEVDTVFSFTVLPSYLSEMDTLFLCEGDSLAIFGNYQTESGIYADSLNTILGCDSVLVKFLQVLPTYTISLDDLSICANDSILVFETYETLPGIYVDSLITIMGCDSIFTQELTVLDLPVVIFSDFEDEIVCLDVGAIGLGAIPSGGVFYGDGVTENIFTPSAAGEGDHTLYYSFENESGCSNTDSIQITVVDCLGLPNENQTQITIFPNPFDDYTTINFGEELIENHVIVIYNALGQEVYRNERVTGSTLEIKKEQLGVGVYILSLLNPNSEELFSAKLIIE